MADLIIIAYDSEKKAEAARNRPTRFCWYMLTMAPIA
jgi:uncharacterized membrane protein